MSPLPQAVKGAQAKAKGPASEPGIKNEFTRLFSGIGSGIGSNMSTPVPSEHPAHMPPSSPPRGDEPGRNTPLDRIRDHGDGQKRAGSKVRRKRKQRQDENGQELDDGFHSLSKGLKASRQSFQSGLAALGHQ